MGPTDEPTRRRRFMDGGLGGLEVVVGRHHSKRQKRLRGPGMTAPSILAFVENSS